MPRVSSRLAGTSILRGAAGVRYPDRVRSPDHDRLPALIADFHLIALQHGDEPMVLERALRALDEVGPGETAFLPESLAWTPAGSGRAFAHLVAFAQAKNINILTTLNLAPDLHEDLPGRDPDARYNALVIFTRHGLVHVPQATLSPHAFEMDASPDGPGIGVRPYERTNRLWIDWQERLIEARFLICSDLQVFVTLSPAALECDLLVVLGRFAYGAERAAGRLISRALDAGLARTTLYVNALQLPTDPVQPPLSRPVEQVLDATSRVRAASAWASPRSIRNAFYVYEDGEARDFEAVCRLPRGGRIAVPRSRWKAPIQCGEYPVTVVL